MGGEEAEDVKESSNLCLRDCIVERAVAKRMNAGNRDNLEKGPR